MCPFSFGIFSGPWFSMGLEAIVEVIYPVDQAIGSAIQIAAGQIYTVFGIEVSRLLEQDLTAEASLIQVNLKMCTSSTFIIIQVNFASKQFLCAVKMIFCVSEMCRIRI